MTGHTTLHFQKYDGSGHWVFPALRLGSDNLGVWAGVPVGTVLRKVSQPERTAQVDAAWVAKFPPGGGYVFRSYAEPNDCDVYVDVTLEAIEDDTSIRVIDMDFDIIRFRESRGVEVLDEDEFELHRVRFCYPDDVADAARAQAAHWRAALEADELDIEVAARVWHDRMNAFLAS